MQCEVLEDRIRLIPDDGEVDQFNKMFPSSYLRNSKVIQLKEIVTKFGEPTGAHYLVIKASHSKNDS